jgi:hypothetical protein
MLKKLIGLSAFLAITTSTGMLPFSFLKENAVVESVKQSVADIVVNTAAFSSIPNKLTSKPGGDISFLYTNGDSPILINTCKTIPVLVSKKNYKKLKPVLSEVITYLNNDLGTSFKIIGVSNSTATRSWFKEGHNYSSNYRYAPILVSLVNSNTESDLLESSKSAGAAITHPGKGFDSNFIVTGGIALNNKVLKLNKNSKNKDFAKTVLLHEFAHILGLDHMHYGVLKKTLNVNENYDYYPKSVRSLFVDLKNNC